MTTKTAILSISKTSGRRKKKMHEAIAQNIDSGMFKSSYDGVFAGDKNWNSLDVTGGEIYSWDADSTYVKNPPYFEGMTLDTMVR